MHEAGKSARDRVSGGSLQPEEAVDFDNERTVREPGEPILERVAAVAVHDEQLTAGLILPSKPRVGAERVDAGIVLNER